MFFGLNLHLQAPCDHWFVHFQKLPHLSEPQAQPASKLDRGEVLRAVAKRAEGPLWPPSLTIPLS